MKTVLVISLLVASRVAFAGENTVCTQVRLGMGATIEAGANRMEISKAADTLYPIVAIGGKGEDCRNLRYSFRVLKGPYNGDTVSPKEWDKAIKLMMTLER
ncbi:MAG: hypothetical protein V1495_03390 [Pseudomonadota bacterium]